jgi:flagellar hook assembly protein FlgD
MTNTIVTTALPTYVEWLNDFNGPGAVAYNSVSKQIEWKVGDIKASSRKELVFSVSILPSASQVGITPILLNNQQLIATDRFTNSELKARGGQVTAELSSEAGFEQGNGRVTQ